MIRNSGLRFGKEPWLTLNERCAGHLPEQHSVPAVRNEFVVSAICGISAALCQFRSAAHRTRTDAASRPLLLRPILYLQLRDTAKLPDIIGDQRQSLSQCVGGNQKVISADGRTLTLEFGADAAIVVANVCIQR